MKPAPADDSFPPYEPHPLLPGSHLMTMAIRFSLRRCPHLKGGERRIFRVDGETSVMALCRWQPAGRSAPAMVIVHGLGGHAESTYMRGTAEKAYAAGFHAIRLNVRSCGGTEHLSPTLFHSGLTDDLRAVVGELVREDRLQRIYLAGFSMGGNMVLKYLGEEGEAVDPAVRGAASISPPLRLADAARLLDGERENIIYRTYFLIYLKRAMRQKARRWPGRYEIDGIGKIGSLREFDDRYTGPHCGFGDADGYYHGATAFPVLPGIRVPTLIVSAEDDPFIPPPSDEDPRLTENPHLTLLTTSRGGHCSFIGRRPARAADGVDADRYWAENRAVQFCRRLEATGARDL